MAYPFPIGFTGKTKACAVIIIFTVFIVSFPVYAAGIATSGFDYGIEAKHDPETGINYFQSGKFDDAIRAFSDSIAIKPDDMKEDEIYAYLGYAYFCKGWTSEAEKAYSECLDITKDPGLKVEALVALGQLQLDKNNYDKASFLFNEALAMCRENERIIIRTLIGITAYEAGQITEAEDIFSEISEISPYRPVPDYYIQSIKYIKEKDRVLFPTKPKFKKDGAGGSGLQGILIINSGDKYTMNPHVKLGLGTKTGVPLEGFFISDGDGNFRWHKCRSVNIEWRLCGEEDGKKEIHVAYYTKGFQQAVIVTESIVLDRKPPWGSFDINGGSNYTNKTLVELNFNIHDNLSGVKGFCLSNDGVNWTDWMAFQRVIRNWQLPLGDGKKKIYAYTHDGAGNISDLITSEIQLDTVPPMIWSVNVAHLSPTSVRITWITDKDSDSAVEYRTDSGKKSTTITVRDGKRTALHAIYIEGLEPSTGYRFRVLSRDIAGNRCVSREYAFVTGPSDGI